METTTLDALTAAARASVARYDTLCAAHIALRGALPTQGAGGAAWLVCPTHTLVAERIGAVTTVRSLEPAPESPSRRYTPRAATAADIDGDGHLDVIVDFAGEDAYRDAAVTHWYGAYRGRPDSATVMQLDLESQWALADVTSLAQAVQRATAVSRRAIAPEVACRIVSEARTVAGFQRVATTDARVMEYGEPGMYALEARARPVHRVTTRMPCAGFECDGSACEAQDDAHPDMRDGYWFVWDGDQPRLAVFATYSGG